MTAPDTSEAAARLAASLAVLHAHLVTMHADAAAARLPDAATMGLQWLRDDAADTLATLRVLAAQKEPTA